MRGWTPNNAVLLLLLVVGLGVVGHNRLVVVAAGLLLLMELTGSRLAFTFLRRCGATLGFILLVSSLLTSFIVGEEPLCQIGALLEVEALVATLVAGIAASVLCKQGMELLKLKPGLIIGLIVGSLGGVLILKGVPVGPFVAAGMTGVVLRLLQ